MKRSMKYYGCYRGEVLQLLNNGFCRIRIPSILEMIDGDVNTLPVAEPAQNLGGGGDTLNGIFTYPDLNSIVWCFFEGGNIERPVYFATSNVRSTQWDNITVPDSNNTNKGNDGITVTPVGHIIKFGKTSMQQQEIVNSDGKKTKGSKIDIKIEATSEQEEMYNTEANNNSEEDSGFLPPVAASIHMDNKRNNMILTAKNSIVLRAPNIIFDTTELEKPGYILLRSNEIDNLTSNGNYRIMASLVNIDGGVLPVVIQTADHISLLEGVSAGITSAKALEKYDIVDE